MTAISGPCAVLGLPVSGSSRWGEADECFTCGLWWEEEGVVKLPALFAPHPAANNPTPTVSESAIIRCLTVMDSGPARPDRFPPFGGLAFFRKVSFHHTRGF